MRRWRRRESGEKSRLRLKVGATGLIALLLTGCAHIPEDLGINEVKVLSQSRSSTSIEWPNQEDNASQVAAILEQPLTAESAVRITMLRSPEVAKVFAELGISRADLIEASTLPNPSLGALARFGLGDVSGTMLDLDGSFPLLDAVMLPLRRSIEQQHFEGAKLHAADSLLRHIAEVRIAWYETVAAQLDQVILAHSREAALAAADLAQAQYDAGNVSRLELLGHQSFSVQTRVEVRMADAEALSKQQSLRRAIALRTEDPEWMLMPAFPKPTDFTIDPATIVQTALTNRLDLAAATYTVDAMEHALRLTKRFRFTGMLDVGVSAEREFDGEWSLGPSLDLELPIFDRKRGAVMRFQSLVALAQAEREALEAEIRAEVDTLAARLSAASEGVRAYQDELLPLHKDLVAQAQLHYNSMLIGVYELLNIKHAELGAQRGAVHAQLDYWRTRAELERAIAGALPDGGSPETTDTDAAAASATPIENDHNNHTKE